MTRKPPVTWTHQEVAVLARLHALHPHDISQTVKSFERHTPADVRDKLTELGLVPKPEKPTLSDIQRTAIDSDLRALLERHPFGMLTVRHAIKHFQALLPKREKKAVPAQP